ncbi:ABC transporter ATP-binding protein [Phytoactinopolyspora alkaliphila]|uniref:ABC transporter ATP-binding protein n=1 Tax=Phytoactinopolyspora alkaliphila TaxID=1783498 RepID=A0A6N9YNT1_9ACTN|nr:ABC transporter ATP-binding protein [Phytoactinopolyspora alkaliphila]NED96498.1 ABC transporter ATP-binding protein [Phytoactinopolyspora alkaliphila]
MTGGSFVEVRGLRVGYKVPHGVVQAIDGVDLTIDRGEALGIVGESGCGKSTLGLGLLRLLPSNATTSVDTFRVGDTDVAGLSQAAFRREVRWKRVSMVFQSAMNSLNPVRRVGEQVADAYRLHHPQASKREVQARVDRLFELVDIPRARQRNYAHEYSGGMRQRAVIALSLVCDPDVVIADEATTALDVVVQNQILDALADLRTELGIALIVISHDIGVISHTCDRVAVMYAGQVVESGAVADVLASPRHPYTASLMAALPRLTGPRFRPVSLPGSPPDLADPPTACRFAPRCPIAADICTDVPPAFDPDHRWPARCHFAGDERLRQLGTERTS